MLVACMGEMLVACKGETLVANATPGINNEMPPAQPYPQLKIRPSLRRIDQRFIYIVMKLSVAFTQQPSQPTTLSQPATIRPERNDSGFVSYMTGGNL